MGDATWLAPLAVVCPIVGAAILVALGRHVGRRPVDILSMAVVLGNVVFASLLLHATSTGRVVTWSGGWTPDDHPMVGIAFVVDDAGAGLALLVSVLAAAALLFGWRYFEEIQAHYHALMLLFVAGLTGFALTGDLFNMFVWFELLSVSAYALAGFKVEEPDSVQAAFAFGVVNSLGGYLCLLGIGFLYAQTGQLGLAQVSELLPRETAVSVAAFTLVSAGWLVKAAAVPFHFWLADAHAVAPTPVCVLFSGVMAPLGVYGVARVYWIVFSDSIPELSFRSVLLGFGVATAVLGTIMCWTQRHIKRLLAYSTIAHIGLFMIGLSALDEAGVGGTAIYLVGHACAKGALFLLTGILLSRYDSVDEIGLHGRASQERALGVMFIVSALALSGLPPFGAALGKAAVEESVPLLAAAVVVAVSIVTGAAAMRAGFRVYFGLGPTPTADPDVISGEERRPETTRELSKPPPTMVAAAGMLVGLALVIGIVPLIAEICGRAGAALTQNEGYVAEVVRGAAVPVIAHRHPPEWTVLGVGIGIGSVVLAVGLALAAVYGLSLVRKVPLLDNALDHLQRLHSGHVGDYVAWLALGVSALAGVVVLGA